MSSAAVIFDEGLPRFIEKIRKIDEIKPRPSWTNALKIFQTMMHHRLGKFYQQYRN
jgi:hypothetical protein